MQEFVTHHGLLEQKNLTDTAVWIQSEFSRLPSIRQIDVPFLLEANEHLLRNVYVSPDVPCISGQFRAKRVEVRTPHGIYHPPEPEEVPSLLNSHLQWLEILKVRKTQTVSRAIQLISGICAIHPFLEGNGRTARMAGLALLFSEGYCYRNHIELETFLERRRRRWSLGMWLAVKGSLGSFSTLYNEAVSVSMQRPRP